MDLRSYGLNWSLNADSSIAVPADFIKRLNGAVVKSSTVIEFTGVNPNTYTLGNRLGGGTFGSVFDCVRASDNKALVIKVASPVEPYGLIKEALIQILIVEATKDKKHPEIEFYGPYAPYLYDIAYDAATGTGYIVSQKMNKTVHASIVERMDPSQSSELHRTVCRALIQISTMIEELGKSMNFNHRDFKTDNCMYFRDDAGKVQLRLIDFGFSTIKYHNMTISGRGIGFKHTYLPERDLTQLMYELYAYHKYIPGSLKKPIEDLLTFPNKRSVCKMYNSCGPMQRWKNTYVFLNNDKVRNPNGQPKIVKAVFLKVKDGLDYTAELAYAPGMMGLFTAKPSVPIVPPKGKVYNPDTGRYVLATGAVGRKLVAQIAVVKKRDKAAVIAGIGIKACPAAKPDYNPKTRRCVKSCPVGQKRNAATFKCIKKIAAAVAHSPKRKVCPAAKPDYNPMTKRCVKPCPTGKKRDGMFKCVSNGTRRKKAAA